MNGPTQLLERHEDGVQTVDEGHESSAGSCPDSEPGLVSHVLSPH